MMIRRAEEISAAALVDLHNIPSSNISGVCVYYERKLKRYFYTIWGFANGWLSLHTKVIMASYW